jgi:hypothetical protein
VAKIEWVQVSAHTTSLLTHGQEVLVYFGNHPEAPDPKGDCATWHKPPGQDEGYFRAVGGGRVLPSHYADFNPPLINESSF